jgi:predicted alpha/beta-fold hydrolase
VEFAPHPWLRNGHLQTLAGMAPGAVPEAAERHEVELPDGDRLVLHDNRPPAWRAGARVALLVHGLCGAHHSGYLCRVAARLNAAGVRTFRVDLRGCGAGVALARHPYHSGRSEDVHAALVAIARLCPHSPTSLVAFSLGANIALKLLGECGDRPPGGLDRAVAVSPPVDLAACVAALRTWPARFYDRFFTATLMRQVRASPTLGEAAARIFATGDPTRLVEFDDAFTAPLSGFGDAATYYRLCSAAPLLGAIRVPTTILSAQDDPIVPWRPLAAQALSASTSLHLTAHGGHLGFIAGAADARRWMDEQVTAWAAAP